MVRFGAYGIRPETRILLKNGRRVKLYGQSLDVLLMLLERPGDPVTREDLKRRLWPDHTFVDFDHGLNTAISNLRRTLGDCPVSPRFVETIPRLGYRFIAEVSCENERVPQSEPSADEHATTPSNNLRDVPGLHGTPTLHGALQERYAEQERIPSIAVLPFLNLSDDGENDYFSDGLAEEILNELTQSPGLRVIARASAFAFRGREHQIDLIADKLHVSNIVHGTVRRVGKRLRVTAQLIDVSDHTQVWSDRYDRNMRDLFDIQDEIAIAIVRRLRTTLGEKKPGPHPVRHYTENLEAQNLYLKGIFHFYGRNTPGELDKGREYLERAVAAEPRHAPAWVRLADCSIASAWHGRDIPPKLWPKALCAASTAVEIDPEFADAQAALGFVEATGGYEWTKGMDRLNLAIMLKPRSPWVHFWRGIVLRNLGRFSESLEELHFAAQLDPLSTLFGYFLAELYVLSGQPAKAVEHARNVLEFEPEYGLALAVMGEAFAMMGSYQEGVFLLEKARLTLPGDNYCLGWLAWTYTRMGRRTDAATLVKQMEHRARSRYVSSGTKAMVSLAAGDTDRALKIANEAVEERDPNLILLLRTPYCIEALRSDPRLSEIYHRTKLDI